MQLNTEFISTQAHNEAEKMLAKIIEKYEAKVRADLENFAKDFSVRYPNHVVKFSDGMGQRSIDLYHRLRQEPDNRIMWFTDGESFNEYTSSDYSFLSDHKAYQEVIELLENTSKELCKMYTISASDWICTDVG